MRTKPIMVGAAGILLTLLLAWALLSNFGRGDLTQAARQPEEASQPVAGLTRFQTPPELQDEAPPAGTEREFSTAFSIHSVSYTEILSGGPPKDGIPAIDEPKFISVVEADTWLRPQEPVILVEVNDQAKAYPIQILTWHEIVNDTVGGTPVAVTFCPLCNTAIVFDRSLDGTVLDFGTSGRLRHSNLIMYDRQTESWWQQASGEAIAGLQTGTRLTFLPGAIISWEDFRAGHPDGLVLSRDTGFVRSYGSNPYAGYDDINSSPFLFRGQTDGTLPPMARVWTIELGGETVAYPYDLMAAIGVANDVIAGQPVVVFWQAGTESAFRENRGSGDYRDVGTANSFSPEVDGQVLQFRMEKGRIVDEPSGSVWNLLGEAVEGPLAGTRLAPVVGVNHFWFSWAAFKPETRVYTLEQ